MRFNNLALQLRKNLSFQQKQLVVPLLKAMGSYISGDQDEVAADLDVLQKIVIMQNDIDIGSIDFSTSAIDNLRGIFSSKKKEKAAGDGFISALMSEVEFVMRGNKFIVTVDEEYMSMYHTYMTMKKFELDGKSKFEKMSLRSKRRHDAK